MYAIVRRFFPRRRSGIDHGRFVPPKLCPVPAGHGAFFSHLLILYLPAGLRLGAEFRSDFSVEGRMIAVLDLVWGFRCQG
jgi:hypothetical protein